ILAIIGPNGAGKTTVFNLVAGALSLTAGEVWFRQKRIDGRPPHRITSLGIARTFQNVQLFDNLSVVENVMVGRHCRAQAGVIRSAIRFPSIKAEEREVFQVAMERLALVGLERRAFESAKSLPFGQQKLLEIARALASDPMVLMLDEPAGGLNDTERGQLADLILRLCEGGMTIVLVEHDMSLVMGVAKWVVVLNYGEKVAEGPPDQVRANEAVIAAYLGMERG
ncbi:MAG: ABC transporter ATP-binding protein, partial [Dehalococcoidia bacterium]|nr:ABC transporter ATP-binding protein [Dehalococcoidia bacterium]